MDTYNSTASLTLEGILADRSPTERIASPYVQTKYRRDVPVSYVSPLTRYRLPNLNEENIGTCLKKEFGEFGISDSDIVFNKELIVEKKDDKLHSIFADIYLPKHGLSIEYNGGEGKPGEDERYAEKDEIYRRNELKHFVIHKDELHTGDWKPRLKKLLEDEKKKADSLSYDWLDGALAVLGFLALLAI